MVKTTSTACVLAVSCLAVLVLALACGPTTTRREVAEPPTATEAHEASSASPARGGAIRECVYVEKIWPENRRPIPVCWEAVRTIGTPGRCACADGTETTAECHSQVCRHACDARGGEACGSGSVQKLACDTTITNAECTRRRTVVREAIDATWVANSKVRFTGWGMCTPGAQGIHIKTFHGRSRSAVGTSGDGREAGMHLDVYGSDDTFRKTAIHEFGHALGFKHEQAREDTPGWCREDDNDLFSGCETSGTVWDASSVMNYCNPQWNGNGTLSAADIEMVRRYYDATVSPGCASPLVKCGDRCVDPRTDGQHCGGCGRACTAQSHACVGSRCEDCRCLNSCGTTPCGDKCKCDPGYRCDGTTCKEQCDCAALSLALEGLQEAIQEAPTNQKAKLKAQIDALRTKIKNCGC